MGGAAEIDSPASKCKVFVIPTQEELCIAQQALEVCNIVKPKPFKAPHMAKASHRAARASWASGLDVPVGTDLEMSTGPSLGLPALFLAALGCMAMVNASKSS